jgi:hypothetical protein
VQIFINVPWYFGALYSLYGKIITPRSKSKVVVARPDKVTETLFKYEATYICSFLSYFLALPVLELMLIV